MSIKLLRKIFSIHNSFSKRHKVITILGINIKIRRKGAIETYFKIYNEKIGNADSEIIHIMANNIYTKTFYDMVKKYSDINRHNFICYRGHIVKYLINQNDKNVLFGNIETLNIDLSKNKKIIIHGILEPELFNWLYSHPEYLKRTYWSIWSSDFYKFQGKKYDYVKKNVKAIITIYDEKRYIERYGTKKCLKAYYLNPLYDKFTEPKQKSYKQILVNQSVRRCTIDALKTLSKYKDEEIKIITPLGYCAIGEDNAVKDEIIKIGKELFGDKYIPLTEYIAPNIYAEILSNTDIMVSNLENNGAVGNLAGVLYCGGKIFLRECSTSFDAFKKGNIITYSYDTIESLNFKEFIKYDKKIKDENINNIKTYFLEEYVYSLWQKVFDDEVNNDKITV